MAKLGASAIAVVVVLGCGAGSPHATSIDGGGAAEVAPFAADNSAPVDGIDATAEPTGMDVAAGNLIDGARPANDHGTKDNNSSEAPPMACELISDYFPKKLPPGECLPNQVACASRQWIFMCASGSWLLWETCGEKLHCVDGKCVPMQGPLCTPGELHCLYQSLGCKGHFGVIQCKPSGYDWNVFFGGDSICPAARP